MDKLIQKQKSLTCRATTEGFSTIELMLAMGIMALVLTAVVMTSFGSQSFLIGSQTSAEAIKIAQGLIEQEQALARKDFNLVNSTLDNEADTTFCPTTIGGSPIKLKRYNATDIYCYRVDVNTKSPDYVEKEVTIRVTWKDERGEWKNEEQMEKLTTLVANFDSAIGGNTCDSTLSGDWSDPQIESTINFSALSGIPVGIYTITDLDAYRGKLYVTAGKTSNNTDPTLFVFNINDTTNPVLTGKTDNASSVTLGLNAVRVSEDPSTNNIYAYTASNSASNYTSCVPATDPACGQLDIFNVNDSIPTISANLKINDSPAITGQNTGTSIFFRNQYILLGLSANSTGPEFSLIDVHNPSLITKGSIPAIGSFEVGNDVNSVNMKSTYAYIASPNTQELKNLNLSDPTCPPSTCLAGGFSTGSGNGKAMQLIGDKFYFGRTTDSGSGEEFQILNNATPNSTLPELGGIDIGDSVNGVIVRDYLSFILTNTDLRIYRTDDPTNITSFATPLALPQTGSGTEPSMDCEGNRLYVSSNNGSGQGFIYIIKPGP